MLDVELIKQIIGGPSDFKAGWIIILVSAILTIFLALLTFFKWLSRKIQKKARLLERISQLAVGTHIGHFETLLGNPTFINKKNDNYNESIFINSYFYVQAIASLDGVVCLFSVTTRSRRFRPILKIGGSAIVELGKTIFSKLGDPKKFFTDGHHGGITYYSELYYFGYDGYYQDYIFGFNESGYGSMNTSLSFYYIDVPEDPEATKKFRNETVINTYTVGSVENEDYDGIRFGPSYGQVRVLEGEENNLLYRVIIKIVHLRKKMKKA